MKILWLAHESNISGANLCLLEYLKILQEDKVENFLIIPFGEGNLASQAETLNVPVIRIKFYSWTKDLYNDPLSISEKFRRYIRNVYAVSQINKIIKKIDPDYIVTNTIVVSVAARAAKKAGKNHIWFIHEFGAEDHGFIIGNGFDSASAIMNRLSTKLVFNSAATIKKYNHLPPDKINLVTYAVDVPRMNSFQTKDWSTVKLILLGQIAPSKNHLEALEALRICRSKGLNVILTIVGKSENLTYVQQLNSYIELHNLSEHVHFTGPNPKPFDLVAQHHCMLMCSRNEAFGRVTVESLKTGVPVIGANQGGTAEIIEDGINGYLYKSGNAPDLADTIIMMCNNHHLFDSSKISAAAYSKYNSVNTLTQLKKVFTPELV